MSPARLAPSLQVRTAAAAEMEGWTEMRASGRRRSGGFQWVARAAGRPLIVAALLGVTPLVTPWLDPPVNATPFEAAESAEAQERLARPAAAQPLVPEAEPAPAVVAPRILRPEPEVAPTAPSG